ncbi:MAG: hypothetical protein KJ609_16220 [Gammaproteobacteria bacterium]|nr:hypothetical protein [Gammaproteobacteria bacterium]MBU1467338.1 hypothetical protein [Gammaproteobacteria bacterium]MBU2236710.1 hypothetical protein [Gammaproteobacteria bacterium]MBU2320099.1 hypothetical protein [Gammaproteobacteria bacterium]
MEILIFAGIIALLACLSAGPCLLIWSLSAKWLPEKYYFPPIKMTFLCVVLSLFTAYAINFELEGGGISILIAILFLSTIWSAVLLPILLVFKLFAQDSCSKRST